VSRSKQWMRSLDRAVGIPLIAALGALRQRKPLPADPRRIGIIIPTAIGDTILASGVVWEIARRYPSAALTVFHGASNASAVRMIDAPLRGVQCNFTWPFAALKALRAEGLDLIVDLTPWTRMTAICARLAAPVTVGFVSDGQGRAAAFDIASAHRIDRHEAENHAELARLFGASHYRPQLKTECYAAPPDLALDRLVVCHTTAGGSQAVAKAWPDENWSQLIRILVSEGWQAALTGAASDAPKVDAILAGAGAPAPQALSLCGKLSLPELGDLLRRARLLITIDTGVLHLGSTVEANIVALHGPTLSSRWGARNTGATSLDSPHPDAGYIAFGYEIHPRGEETMRAHSVEAVARAALSRLALSKAAEEPSAQADAESRALHLESGI